MSISIPKAFPYDELAAASQLFGQETWPEDLTFAIARHRQTSLKDYVLADSTGSYPTANISKVKCYVNDIGRGMGCRTVIAGEKRYIVKSKSGGSHYSRLFRIDIQDWQVDESKPYAYPLKEASRRQNSTNDGSGGYGEHHGISGLDREAGITYDANMIFNVDDLDCTEEDPDWFEEEKDKGEEEDEDGTRITESFQDYHLADIDENALVNDQSDRRGSTKLAANGRNRSSKNARPKRSLGGKIVPVRNQNTENDAEVSTSRSMLDEWSGHLQTSSRSSNFTTTLDTQMNRNVDLFVVPAKYPDFRVLIDIDDCTTSDLFFTKASKAVGEKDKTYSRANLFLKWKTEDDEMKRFAILASDPKTFERFRQELQDTTLEIQSSRKRKVVIIEMVQA